MDNKETIIVSNRNQPIIEVDKGMGLNRDRQPDSGWGEFRRTNMDSNSVSEVLLTKELKQILIEDIACYYGNDSIKFIEKLKEFNLWD